MGFEVWVYLFYKSSIFLILGTHIKGYSKDNIFIETHKVN